MITIYSFPRSGTHWLLSLLEQGIGAENVNRTGYVHHLPKEIQPADDSVYIFRDVRDVALSHWRRHKFREQFGNLENFLHTIVPRWHDHLIAWRCEANYLVRYENLIRDTVGTMTELCNSFGFQYNGTGDVGDVGIYPSGDYRANKWRGCFTKADNAIVYSYVVGRDFWGLDNGKH